MGTRRLTAEDWAVYRDIRLAALLADPEAFASIHEREAAFDEATWRQRITVGPDGRPLATFVDGVDPPLPDDASPLGTTAILYTEHHEAPMLVAMWVRPEARGRGTGRRLLDAACSWARQQGERQVVLWVVRDNEPAIGLYEAYGFRPTGVVDVLPSNPCVGELEMILDLDADLDLDPGRG